MILLILLVTKMSVNVIYIIIYEVILLICYITIILGLVVSFNK